MILFFIAPSLFSTAILAIEAFLFASSNLFCIRVSAVACLPSSSSSLALATTFKAASLPSAPSNLAKLLSFSNSAMLVELYQPFPFQRVDDASQVGSCHPTDRGHLCIGF